MIDATLPPEQSRFLTTTPWSDWPAEQMPGDADSRLYWRLHGPGGATAILMDMRNGTQDAFAAFLLIGDHLARIGLAPPQILARQDGTRMLLLEDLGPLTLARAAAADPAQEPALYRAATEILIAIGAAPPPPGLGSLTPAKGAEMLAPLFEWYAPRPRKAEGLEIAMADALAAHAGPPSTLCLRDFFSENLIWRGDRTGTDRIGLLDFQDALLAPAAYDLASLLRDARRDVTPAAADAAMRLFADQTGQTIDALGRAVAVLSVQRNLRILGIFARLARRDGKPRYLPMLPRVRAHILADIAHPSLVALRPAVEAALAARPFA